MTTPNQILTLDTLPVLPQSEAEASVQGIASVTETRKILKFATHGTGRALLLHVRHEVPSVAHGTPTDVNYRVRGCLKITPKQANEFLTEYYEKPGLSAMGAYVPISVHHNMIFIGG